MTEKPTSLICKDMASRPFEIADSTSDMPIRTGSVGAKRKKTRQANPIWDDTDNAIRTMNDRPLNFYCI
ncbi:uncharacterized protein N7477_009275 [Penicillium maclennaniae]|uniref:uncharacterized protein n=1 Tax=Penicillium maclennaniae TaxID=1343394 RepID=UPI002541A6A0|nr:uncharacterized protein N7477_009275 [Penicillium maclennaniae]KAJ5661659.1 hypothetical protein N7477_009275 [Penicillium maclennaniae]